MCSGVQYKRTWVIEHVLLLLFVLMMVIVCVLVDFFCVVCCACLCFHLDPGRVVFKLFRVAAFHVGVLRFDEASLFVTAAGFCDVSGRVGALGIWWVIFVWCGPACVVLGSALVVRLLFGMFRSCRICARTLSDLPG